jgi:hypothetical protein
MQAACLVIGQCGSSLPLAKKLAASRINGNTIDLLGAFVLQALGLRELLSAISAGGESPAWTKQLDRLSQLPLLPLIGLSTCLELISPDDLLLLSRSAAQLLARGLNLCQELLAVFLVCASASMVLFPPLLAILVRWEAAQPLLKVGRAWLNQRGEMLTAVTSLLFAAYLDWVWLQAKSPAIP